jgi:disulfide bond formation protein DsbB
MLNAFPLSRTIRETLTGSGECASVDWTFLGLSMPWWVLVWFILLGGLLVLAAGLRNGRQLS